MRKRGVVGRIYGMKYRVKSHKDRNRYKNRIKKELASSVGLRQKHYPQHPHYVKVSPRGLFWTESLRKLCDRPEREGKQTNKQTENPQAMSLRTEPTRNFRFDLNINDRCLVIYSGQIPQWGAADAEIKVPFGETTELNGSPFKAWSRSVYSHTCYAYCQGFLPCSFLPFSSIHLHFAQNLSWVFPVSAMANTGFCVGSQNKKGHPAGCRFPCWVFTEYKYAPKHVLLFFWFCVPKLSIEFELWFEQKRLVV